MTAGRKLTRQPVMEAKAMVSGALNPPREVWLSRRFLVQVFFEGEFERITVNRTVRIGPDWAEGITWDELQQIKHDIGRGDRWAAECYPPDRDVVNVANMRHLFVLPSVPPFGWTGGAPAR